MITTTFTLADQLLLLALDDTTGAVHSDASVSLDFGLVGAVLAELTLNNRLSINGNYIAVTDRTPLENMLLNDALNIIGASSKARSAQSWVTRLSSDLGGLRQRLLDDLVARGVLERQESRILFVFPVTRYPERDGQIENAIRVRLDQALLEGADPDAHTMLLIQLAKSCGLVKVLYTRDQRARVSTRIEELNTHNTYSQAVAQAVASAQSTMDAAIIAATTAATTSCSTTTTTC